MRTLFSNSMGSPGAQTRRPTSDGMYLTADLGQLTPRFIVELSSKFDNDYSEIIRSGDRFFFISVDESLDYSIARIKN